MKNLISTFFIVLYFLLSANTFAQQNWQQADSLRQVYQNNQSYDTALVYAEQALTIVEKQYGINDTLYADMLIGIMEIAYYTGEYDKAVKSLLQEKEIRENTQGKEHPAYGTTIGNLAVLYESMGQYEKALPLHLEALKITEKAYGKEHEEYGIRLNNLALVYESMGQYEKALPLYHEALENTEKNLGKEHSDYGTSLNNLAGLYSSMGQYEKALPLLLEALNNAEKNFGKEHLEYVRVLNNLALLYRSMGQYEKALPLFIETLNGIETVLGKEHSYYGISLNNLAGIYDAMGQYEKALPLFLEALESTEKTLGKEHSSYGISLNNLAGLYLKMGQYEKALPLLLAALENTENALGKEHSSYGRGLNNLALLYENMDQNEKALPLYLEALKNIEKSLGKEHTEYGNTLNNLALLYESMGEYEKALPLYLEAIENAEKALGKEHSEYSIRLNNLALLYERMGQYEKALPLYLEVLETTEKVLGKEHTDYGTYLFNLAGLYETMGNYKKALPLYTEGIANINNNVGKNFSFLSEKGKEAYFNMKSRDYNVFNTFALKSIDQIPNITTTVFDNTVRNKGILLKSSTAMRTAILSSKDTVLINKYNSWISLNKEIVSLYSMPKNNRQKDPKKLEEQANVLERDLVRNSQEFSIFTNTLKTNWKDVQKALKPNEIAIEFMHFKVYGKSKFTDTTMYCALIVTPQSSQPHLIQLFREKQLEKIIGKFGGNNYSYINSIYGKNSEVNTALYDLIWAKIDNYLDSLGTSQKHSDTKLKVYLSPSGLLHKISFSAIAKKQNVYLCDAYNIEVKATTGKITEHANRQASKSDLMNTATLFGGITYNTDSTKQEIWSYLEGTKIETQKIDKILKKGKVNVNYYSSTSATEEEFKQMASNSNIIHIATHGFFYPDPKEIEKEETENINANDIVFRGGTRGFGVTSFMENNNPLMRSGLVFAGANDVWNQQTQNDTIEDGVLTAQEVAQIDMRKTKLVVMSACETGLGDIKGSEGVYGLQRAFKMAGVQYEIMSLWQVPDKETEEFMTLFYRKLIKQNDIKQAFAQTQKEMRVKHDPYFWAAFVLIE